MPEELKKSPRKIKKSVSFSLNEDVETGLGDQPSEREPLLAEAKGHATEKIVHERGGTDILQFSSSMFYAGELQSTLSIHIIRLGTMEGVVSAHLSTEDLSAKSSRQYQSVSRQVVFEDGEHTKSIDINIFDDGKWTATTEFKVNLTNPKNCHLGEYLFCARVKILNSQAFPSDALKDDIEKGEESIQKISDWLLFREYCKLNFTSTSQRRNTIVVLILDQLNALFLFGTLWVGVYIVDTIFDRGTASSKRLFVPDRYHTAMIIALWYAIPCFVLYAWESTKVHMDIQGTSRSFLQTSIMQTTLSYSPESRNRVTTAEWNIAIGTSADQIASAYVAALTMVGLAGRILAIVVFMLWFQAEPFAIGCVIIMVLLLVVFTVIRVGAAQQAQENVEAKMMLVETLTDESCSKYRLFADYFKRPLMTDMFTAACDEYCKAMVPYTLIKLQTGFTTKFISSIFIAVYIVVKTPAVLSGHLSLGVFLATVTIFSTYLADAITELNNQLMVIVDSFVPLKEYTTYMNYPLELTVLKQVSEYRQEESKVRRAEILAPHSSATCKRLTGDNDDTHFKSDLIPIEISGLTYEPSPGNPVFKDFSMSLPQGHLVAITGPVSSGKKCFVELLSNILLPTRGHIFIPSHLRVLHVAREPLFMHTSMLHNLTLGLVNTGVPNEREVHRICGILSLMGLADVVDIVKEEWHAAEDKKSAHHKRSRKTRRKSWQPETIEDHDADIAGVMQDEAQFMGCSELAWEHLLTQSQKVKLNIARALICNPEVIVMERTLQGLNEECANKVLDVLRQHVEERGLCKPEGRARRRPRDIFFSTENRAHASRADAILQLDPVHKTMTMTDMCKVVKKRRQDTTPVF